MAKAKPTPYDITIETGYDERLAPDHQWIELRATATSNVPLPTELAGHRWCAGVFGRVGLAVLPRLLETRDGHGCRTKGQDTCGLTLSQPHPIEGLVPTLTIDLPFDSDLDSWLELVTTKLNELIEADRWQPDEDDQ